MSTLDTHAASDPELTPEEVTPLSGPVLAGERIRSLDALRGVALLGILLLNIKSFAMPDAAYMNPTAYGDLTGVNWWVWYVQFIFGDQKFMSIFSMLFGAGIVLMTERADARTGSSTGVHYRRMGWLLLFGLAHAHLIWHGDILYTYALCGMLIYLVRKAPPIVLIGIAFMLFVLLSVLMIASNFGIRAGGEEAVAQQQAEMWTPPAEEIQSELETFRGSWFEQMERRVPFAVFFETFLLIFIMPQVLAMMCLGMALYRWGVFSAMKSPRFYVTTALIGGGIGIALTMYNAHLSMQGWPFPESFFLYMRLATWGSIGISLAYIAIVMLVFRAAQHHIIVHALSAVGQMAFTNYIMQSVLCTLIFYGHGLGYFGSLERIEQMGVVAGVWLFQLIVSPIWLHYFRFGPLEWLWRALTYGRRPVMRRA